MYDSTAEVRDFVAHNLTPKSLIHTQMAGSYPAIVPVGNSLYICNKARLPHLHVYLLCVGLHAQTRRCIPVHGFCVSVFLSVAPVRVCVFTT